VKTGGKKYEKTIFLAFFGVSALAAAALAYSPDTRTSW
jgi:hypothetical protein